MNSNNSPLSNVVPAAVIGLAIVFSTWLYTERTRHQIRSSTEGAYKYDRVTGETEFLSGDRYAPVDSKVNFAR
ncbi:MAG: hypothetical protein AAF802_07645 [Planctomycetota bacterium]